MTHTMKASITAGDIKLMVGDLSEPTKELVVRRLRPQLLQAISAVNAKATQLSPPPASIMNAFKLCPVEKIRVVLLGQDPYIKPGEAMGLSFSVPSGVKIPPSLCKIYECLLHHGLIRGTPSSGDLTTWAEQGVLLINAA